MFDESIAQELHDNPLAKINLSIDAGTSETWHKVKGVDNFQHVLNNLKAYRKVSQRAGQIFLKYIVCPGINDSEEDFLSFVNIVKLLDVQYVQISRNVCEPRLYVPSKDTLFSKTIESVARLVAICVFNGIPQGELTYCYTEYEKKCIKFLAFKLLEYMGRKL